MATWGDYTYTKIGTFARVRTTDQTKTTYGALPTPAELGVETIVLRGLNSAGTAYVGCFAGCANMTISPEIPEGVTDMSGCFQDCVALTEAPEIPSTVTDLAACFVRTALIEAPEIPETAVGSMQNCFIQCYSLIKAPPRIPDGITNISGCFSNCRVMEIPPNYIGSGVTDISSCFWSCYEVSGKIIIKATPSTYNSCFSHTEKPIFIGGDYDVLKPIAETSSLGNVRAFQLPDPEPTWQTPITNRINNSRTNANDMMRIAGNLYLCGGYPEKYNYADGDFVTQKEWLTIVNDTNEIATSLGQPTVSDRTSYTNLNKIENIHKLYHDSQE